MKTKNLFFSLILLLSFTFISCERDIPNIIEESAETISWSKINDNFQNPYDYTWLFDLHIDNDDKLWLSSLHREYGPDRAGLWYNEEGQWNYIQAFEEAYPGTQFITGEIVFIDNDIWFGLNNKLIKFDGSQFEEYDFPKTIESDNDLHILHVNENNEMWVKADKYIVKFQDNQWVDQFELPYSPLIYDFQIDNDAIWMSTLLGLFKHHNDTTLLFKEITASLNENESRTIEIRQPFALETDNVSKLFVSTYNGLLIHENGEWQLINNENSIIQENVITSITRDKNDLIWIGTWDGLFTYDTDNHLEKIPIPVTSYCLNCEEEISKIKVDSKNRKIIVADGDYVLVLED